MKDGNSNLATKSCKISVPRKHPRYRRIKAESVPEKSLNHGGATLKSEDISDKTEETAHFSAMPCWIQSQQAMEISDCQDGDARPKNMVEKPTTLAAEPNESIGDEEDFYQPVVQDEREPTKRRANPENLFEGSRTSEQETYAQLEAEIKKLKNENSICCSNMQEISVSCQKLRKENHRLLKKLKKVCAPDTIAYLEARNPDKKVDKPGPSH